jgi:AraC family transcriptional regulator
MPAATNGDTHRLELPGGRTVQAIHVVSFDTIPATYAELEAWMTQCGLHPLNGAWECSLTEPDRASWRTLIVVPIT